MDNPQSQEKTEQVETVPQSKAAKPQEQAPVEKQQPQQEQRQAQQQQPQIELPVEYQPYSMVPPHIKQLIFKMYEPQGPYVDPRVYIYHTPVVSQSEDQTKSTQSQSQSVQPEQKADKLQERVSQKTASQETEKDQQPAQEKVDDYHEATHQEATSYQEPLQQRITPLYHQQQFQEEASMYQQPNAQFAYDKYPVKEGDIEYKNEKSESKPAQHESAPQQTAPESELSTKTTQYALHTQENNMPSLLQQLLHLQAQTPYYVIANRIAYKPRNMFIPKPIYEDDNGSYAYRSKVYYLLDDPVEQEDQSAKYVKQDQRP